MYMKLPINSGLIPETFDPRDIWLDEVVGGIESTPRPKEFKQALGFEPQRGSMMCVSFATTKALEMMIRRAEQINYEFSQPKLFHSSGGSIRGSVVRTNLNTAREFGCVSEAKCPLPEGWSWDWSQTKRLADAVEYQGNEPKIESYARIDGTDTEKLKQAIWDYKAVIVTVPARGGYWGAYKKRPSGEDNHCLILVGYDEYGFIGFDSLQPHTDFDGYHTFDNSYDFYSAYVLLDYKIERDDIYDGREEGFERALNHYGQPRDFSKEQIVAGKLVEEFNKFNNKQVWEAAGKFWTVLVNMGAYGGYSISYTKFGRWQPGDIINQIYHWKRTGEFIFDMNKMHGEEGYRLIK